MRGTPRDRSELHTQHAPLDAVQAHGVGACVGGRTSAQLGAVQYGRLPLAAANGALNFFLRLAEGNDRDPEQVEPGARGLSLVGARCEAVWARERARTEEAHPGPGTEEQNHRLSSQRWCV